MTAVTTHLPHQATDRRPAAPVAGPAVRPCPTVDLTRVVTTAVAATGAVLVARQLARRPAPSIATVTMGPGGWVSLKGGAVAVRRARQPFGRPRPLPAAATAARGVPLWARVISAVPLRRLTA